MDLNFKLRFSGYFENRWNGYDSETRRRIKNKLKLIRTRPFRFRKHKGYVGVFKVKIRINDKYSRLMYAVYFPDSESITILGVFPRDMDYKDFEGIFGFLRK